MVSGSRWMALAVVSLMMLIVDHRVARSGTIWPWEQWGEANERLG